MGDPQVPRRRQRNRSAGERGCCARSEAGDPARPVGVSFDKAYIEWQIGAHKEAIVLFKTESTSGDDLDARQFALATLPMLQADLDHLFAIVIDPQSSPQ